MSDQLDRLVILQSLRNIPLTRSFNDASMALDDLAESLGRNWICFTETEKQFIINTLVQFVEQGEYNPAKSAAMILAKLREKDGTLLAKKYPDLTEDGKYFVVKLLVACGCELRRYCDHKNEPNAVLFSGRLHILQDHVDILRKIVQTNSAQKERLLHNLNQIVLQEDLVHACSVIVLLHAIGAPFSKPLLPWSKDWVYKRKYIHWLKTMKTVEYVQTFLDKAAKTKSRAVRKNILEMVSLFVNMNISYNSILYNEESRDRVRTATASLWRTFDTAVLTKPELINFKNIKREFGTLAD